MIAIARLVTMFQRTNCVRRTVWGFDFQSVAGMSISEFFHEAPEVDVGFSCIPQLVHGGEGDGQSPAPFGQVEHIHLVTGDLGLARWSSGICDAAVLQRGLDTVAEAA